MTPETQRIAIAKACGWEYKEVEVNLGDIADSIEKETGWVSPEGEYVGTWIHLPDYFEDLNAMHEAEKSIPLDKLHAYTHKLHELAAQRIEAHPCYSACMATAAQRAEAFLRTLGAKIES